MAGPEDDHLHADAPKRHYTVNPTLPCPLRAIPLDCRAVARSAEAVLVFDVQNDGDGFRSMMAGRRFAAGGRTARRAGRRLRRA
ncbi:MAG: hypothetical protein ACLSHC_04670 [Bilophila wadsworthia]